MSIFPGIQPRAAVKPFLQWVLYVYRKYALSHAQALNLSQYWPWNSQLWAQTGPHRESYHKLMLSNIETKLTRIMIPLLCAEDPVAAKHVFIISVISCLSLFISSILQLFILRDHPTATWWCYVSGCCYLCIIAATLFCNVLLLPCTVTPSVAPHWYYNMRCL